MKKSNVFKLFPVMMVMGLLVGIAVVSCNKEDHISPMVPTVEPDDTLPQVDTLPQIDTTVVATDSAILKGQVLCQEGDAMPGSYDVHTYPFECDVVIVSPVKIALSSYNVSLSSLGVTEVARVRPKPSNGKYRVKIPVGEYSVLPVVDGMVIAAGLARNGQGYANYVSLSANEIKTYNITVKYLVE